MPRPRQAAPSAPQPPDLYEQPGHLVRRAQQICVSLFVDTVGPEVTPIQYAVLHTLHESPGLDQVTLARYVALDTSTTADLAARLETKGWVARELMARRQRRLTLTAEGEAVLRALAPKLQVLQQRILGNLEGPEQAEFIRLLRKFVHLNNEASRAPLRRDEPPPAAG